LILKATGRPISSEACITGRQRDSLSRRHFATLYTKITQTPRWLSSSTSNSNF